MTDTYSAGDVVNVCTNIDFPADKTLARVVKPCFGDSRFYVVRTNSGREFRTSTDRMKLITRGSP